MLRPLPAAIIKITKPQPCAGFKFASIKHFPTKNGYEFYLATFSAFKLFKKHYNFQIAFGLTEVFHPAMAPHNLKVSVNIMAGPSKESFLEARWRDIAEMQVGSCGLT